MAATPLEKVESPKDIRDEILSAYGRYKKWKGAGVPDKLFSTLAHKRGHSAPTHSTGDAIDVVTDSHGNRRYLMEFGLFLFATQKRLSVYFYPVNYESHIHVGDRSGFGSGSWLVLVPGTDKAKKPIYQKYKREEVPAKAAEIIQRFKIINETYAAGAQVDYDFWQKVLEGKETLESESGFKAFLKKYWWLGLISVGLLVIVALILKMRKGSEGDTDGL